MLLTWSLSIDGNYGTSRWNIWYFTVHYSPDKNCVLPSKIAQQNCPCFNLNRINSRAFVPCLFPVYYAWSREDKLVPQNAQFLTAILGPGKYAWSRGDKSAQLVPQNAQFIIVEAIPCIPQLIHEEKSNAHGKRTYFTNMFTNIQIVKQYSSNYLRKNVHAEYFSMACHVSTTNRGCVSVFQLTDGFPFQTWSQNQARFLLSCIIYKWLISQWSTSWHNFIFRSNLLAVHRWSFHST